MYLGVSNLILYLALLWLLLRRCYVLCSVCLSKLLLSERTSVVSVSTVSVAVCCGCATYRTVFFSSFHFYFLPIFFLPSPSPPLCVRLFRLSPDLFFLISFFFEYLPFCYSLTHSNLLFYYAHTSCVYTCRIIHPVRISSSFVSSFKLRCSS